MKHGLLLSLAIILHTFDSLSLVDNTHHISPTNNPIPINNCPRCPFNITVRRMHRRAVQHCPSTPFRVSDTAHPTSSQTIRCVSNGHQIQHHIMNECDFITETPSDHRYYVSIVRRRQLLPSSNRHLHLAKACISYKIIGQRSDCVDSIFLPICLDSIPAELTSSDINSLIADKTFDSGTNVKSAVGAHSNGELGILLELITYTESAHFKLCLKNIIADTQDTEDLTNSVEISSIGTSHGMLIHNVRGNERKMPCDIDGIPCFRFFFQKPPSECVPDTTSDYNGLERITVSAEYSDHSGADRSRGESRYIVYEVVIDLSASLLYNIWALVTVLVVLSIVIYFCFGLKPSSSSADCEDDDVDISNIVLIV